MSLGCPTGQTGVYQPVSQGFPVVGNRKIAMKGRFFGHRPGVPEGVVRNLMWFFLSCLCSSQRTWTIVIPESQNSECRKGGCGLGVCVATPQPPNSVKTAKTVNGLEGCKGQKKHIHFFQHKLFVPHPKCSILCPQRRVDVPHFLGKNAKKGPT